MMKIYFEGKKLTEDEEEYQEDDEIITVGDTMYGKKNLGYCRPYTGVCNGDAIDFVITDGRLTSIMINGVEQTGLYGNRQIQTMHSLARAYNSDFESYDGSGYDSEDILLDAILPCSKEMGCIDCPWFNECEAMKEDIEYAGYECY